MPTFQINTPVLTLGQSFIVRYKLLPSGSWVYIANQTNAPFTISGLSAGSYTLEAFLTFGSPPTICDPMTIPFEVIEEEECDCMTAITGQVLDNGSGVKFIRLTFTAPIAAPSCGWVVNYRNVGTGVMNTLTLPSMASPFDILLPVDKLYCYDIWVYKDCCAGDSSLCWTDNICYVEPPTCNPITLSTSSLIYMGSVVYIKLVFTQPIPPVTNFIVNYTQSNFVSLGQPDSGTYTYSGLTNTLYVPVNPNYNTNGSVLMYFGNITDGCRNVIPFEAIFAEGD